MLTDVHHFLATSILVVFFWIAAAGAVAAAEMKLGPVSPAGGTAIAIAAILLVAGCYTRLCAREAGISHALGVGIAWLILGIVYYDQDKLEHALAALAQAVLLEPKDARAHHYLGVTIGRKGWYSGAEEEMRKAIELQPGYAEAHFNLAVFYLQRSPPAVELARRHYERALELGADPDPDVAKSLTGPKP